MLYFPIFHFVWPDWIPGVGGEYFEFFSPVFNIADSSIFIGVVIILFMQKRFFKETEQPVTHSEEIQSIADPLPPASENRSEEQSA
jgi:signal peptidase II